MNNNPNLRHRFPGAKPFTEEDKEVFYGRENDVQRLYDLLCLKRLMVLYAKSGIGKSSLVNAGLIPKFEDTSTNNCEILAIKIRFGLTQCDEDRASIQKAVLVGRILQELEAHNDRLTIQELPFIEKPAENEIWYQVKLFERNNIILFLVFDQFEEAFAYDNEALNYLKEELFSLFSGIPIHLNAIISQKIKSIEKDCQDQNKLYKVDKDLEFMDTPLKTKVLLVIREDKFGLFNLFNDYFPDILKDSYKLSPLNRSSAQQAIILPAQLIGDFKTPPFTFSSAAIKELLDSIAERNDTFDPFTIQLTCRYLERTLVEQNNKTEIIETDIPEVSVIVSDFINSIWNAMPLGLRRKSSAYKELIEENLIAHDIERRISVHESDWIEDKVVAALINEGLLKRDRRGGVDYIELSHDRLIEPLLKDYNERKQQRAINKRRAFGLGILTLLVFGFILFASQMNKKNQIFVGTLEDSLKIHLLKDDIEERTDSSSYTLSDKELDSLLYAKYKKHLFKIDIFYIDSASESLYNNGVPLQKHKYAELLADQIASVLKQEFSYVVRKKLISPEMRSADKYRTTYNLIKFESDEDKDEVKASASIKTNVWQELQIRLNSQIVKPTAETANYVSIFLKNS